MTYVKFYKCDFCGKEELHPFIDVTLDQRDEPTEWLHFCSNKCLTAYFAKQLL